MKKSTLLSLLTAGAVIATSAGTFAAWDQTKGYAVTDSSVTFRKGVRTTAVIAAPTSTNSDTFGETPEYTATSTINITDTPSAAISNYKVKVSAYAFDSKVDAENAAKGDTAITDANGYNSTITATPEQSEYDLTSGSNTTTINLEITIKPQTSQEGNSALTGYILVTAELVEKNPA